MKFIKALAICLMAIVIITISSCSKNNEASLSTSISAKINGTSTQFTKNILALSGDVNGVAFTSVQGADANGNMLSLTINGQLVSGKTYSTADQVEFGLRPSMLYSTIDGSKFANEWTDKSDVVSIKLTSVSGNYIQGTFRGELVGSLDSIDPVFGSKSITEGNFSAIITK